MLRHSSQQYLLGKPASEKQIVLSSILGMLYPVCLKSNSLVDDVIAHKYLSVADPGEGLGEPIPPPSRICTQTEAQRAEKRFFGLDEPPPLFHLKVWTRHCLSHKGNEGRLCHGWLVHFVCKHSNYAT